MLPEILVPHLKKTMTFFEPNDYAENWVGFLGEFALTNGSGWMYSVNNVYPNVGFADTYLSDGDVVRVRFTLGYGADIGGFGAIGTGYSRHRKSADGRILCRGKRRQPHRFRGARPCVKNTKTAKCCICSFLLR